MLARRFWTPGRSIASLHQRQHQHAHIRSRWPHDGTDLYTCFASHRSHGQEKQIQAFRPYSNFAPRPRDPTPHYYNPYHQPPRSRLTRARDIAIGAILVVGIQLAYVAYLAIDEKKKLRAAAKEFSSLAKKCKRAADHYDKLLRAAEASNDESAESEDKIRDLFMERSKVMTRLIVSKGKDGDSEDSGLEEWGPLPRLPEDRESHGQERIKAEDTLVLIPPQPSPQELADFDREKAVRGNDNVVLAYEIFVVLNYFTKDLGCGGPWNSRADGAGESNLHEVGQRLELLMDALYQAGTVQPSPETIIVMILRDEVMRFVYGFDEEGRLHTKVL
ncbi:hypothetical protein F4777DRAFT_577285 [Nemania sp. FL0916]|nr:hypothetical protein F4777DRAFT_577285 [Nemania sp. FL0916]